MQEPGVWNSYRSDTFEGDFAGLTVFFEVTEGLCINRRKSWKLKFPEAKKVNCQPYGRIIRCHQYI